MYYRAKAIEIDPNVPSVCGAREKYMSYRDYNESNGVWICCNNCWTVYESRTAWGWDSKIHG